MTALRKKLEKQLPDFKSACKLFKSPADKVIPSFEFFPERDREAMQKFSELVLIIRAANKIANGGKEWMPDYSDGKWKSVAWFAMEGKGGSAGFRFDVCDYWGSYSDVGSRLTFFNDEVGEYVTEKFFEHYREFFVIKA